MSLLSVRNLVVGYGDVEVLHGVSLDIEPNSITVVLGANAAGKSTLINAISGIVRARSGQITFNGREITHTPAHEVTNLGLVQVPEGRRVFPFMTVRENLLLGAHCPRARPFMLETLRQVEERFPVLADRANQLAGSLSGGEQQMLAIGRGLMARPTLLMLDEPSLGLAPKIVGQMFEQLKDLVRSGITILLVEQHVHHALSLADSAYVLERGEIVLHGTGREFLADEHLQKAYLGV